MSFRKLDSPTAEKKKLKKRYFVKFYTGSLERKKEVKMLIGNLYNFIFPIYNNYQLFV